MNRIIMMLIMCVMLGGCSGYDFSDRIELGDKSVTKHSVARGLVHKPQMPHHEKSVIDGDDISAGGTSNPSDFKSRSKIWLLYPMGALAVIAGLAVAFFFKRYVTGVAVAVGGIILIAAGGLIESYPWVLLLLPLGAVGAACWFLLDSANRSKLLSAWQSASKALSQTVAGFEKVKEGLSSETRGEMNTAMASAQDKDVQQQIKQIKSEG